MQKVTSSIFAEAAEEISPDKFILLSDHQLHLMVGGSIRAVAEIPRVEQFTADLASGKLYVLQWLEKDNDNLFECDFQFSGLRKVMNDLIANIVTEYGAEGN
jgi:hypothetical protein